MKTPMQELIEQLKEQAQFITDDDCVQDKFYRTGLRNAIKYAESMLEKEKEVIKGVWLDGRNSRINGQDPMEQIKTFNTKEK